MKYIFQSACRSCDTVNDELHPEAKPITCIKERSATAINPMMKMTCSRGSLSARVLINSSSSGTLTHIMRNVPSNPGMIEEEVLRVQHPLLAGSSSCNTN